MRRCLIHPCLAVLTSITKLQLQKNQLSVIPEVLCDLFNLREVSFSENKLTELPHAIPKLTNLCNLLAAENRLKTDPSQWGLPGVSHEIAYMPNLIEINLEKNDLIKVPPKDVRHSSSANQLLFLRSVYEARQSAVLKLVDMEIREIPDVLMLMVNLHTLTISSCGLRSVNPSIKKLTSLTYLELDNNDLVVIPEDATRISNLTELHCSKNQIKKLPETCNRWIRCSKIYATDNHIKTIPDGVCEMPNLTILDLDRNKLRTLPEAFIICSSLTLLHFDTSDMVKASPAKELPDGIRRCEIPAEIAIRGVDEIINHFFKMHEAWSTCSLDLHGLGLRYVMDDVCRLSVLTKLDLSHNRIRVLQSALSCLPELKLVNLDHCLNLEHFHHDLWVLTKLKKITIRAGVLDSWLNPIIRMKWPPTIIARQPDLCREYLKIVFHCVGRHYRKDGVDVVETTQKLDFRFVPHEVSLDPVTAGEIDSEAKRSFHDFPHEIWALGLTNLTWLQLPGGTITSEQMSTHLPKLTDLKKLVLIDQEIQYIPDEVGLLSELNVLCLTGNKIKEIPSFIFKMISLTKLILVENYISKVPPEIGLLTNLTDLVLTYNKISVLPKEIGELWGLDYFVLDENKIRVLPDSIEHLTSLKEFSFNDNKITRFPSSMGNLTQLEILEFAKNPSFSLPPKQVLKCEIPVILNFMNRIWDCRVTGKLFYRNFQLEDNTVFEIIKEIFTSVTDLDLSKNNLKQLTSNLKLCTGLTKINLSENSALKHLNLKSEIEMKPREKPKVEIVTTNLTLRAFFEKHELMHIYDIVSKEYNVKKMIQLNDFIKNDYAMENLGLSPLERMRFIAAVYEVNGEPDAEHNQDKIEQSSASEVQSSDQDSGKEEADEGNEEDKEDKEEVLDDEEAQR
jgi:internalin A